MYRIGIDIGATNMRVALFDSDNQLIAREQVKTEAKLGPVQALGKLVSMVRLVDPERLAIGIGIGAPGPLDVTNGTVLDAPNLPGWHGFPIRDELERLVNVPVFLMNDAKAAALAEAKIGSGVGYDSVQYITVSTGIGGGFICRGELFPGSHGHASELGNMIVDVSSPNSTLENTCSGSALLRQSKQLFGENQTAAELFVQYEANQEEARQVIEQWLHHFSAAVTSIIQVIDPEVFVLGGAVILRHPWLVEKLHPMVTKRVYSTMREDVQLKVASLGDDAGLYGASMFV
ncbi:ROK family protein [Listeria ivanovii]|uniref:Putative sugar kinase n=1 Tax=Listeria ivanovii (strain ATCC BAA-678 / PAM 55) TaxID=881621 RepID=G2ZA04_LISIP|nr:ROK family protein [Listeria ivanovii]AHI55026.1 sugar kinase [Listeria ivanovii WSLC3009]AIS64484.1 sugar kinase [Listeria ivanovii subsp. ivanovii]MBC1758845.1 ROK family protein [Listeria ivanovii]MBK3913703.1 ROK family protein [Listeria ivanovii subsp. ivanovii]MBK3920179.1 ROK family protein [Listeria ivanovii subsp. ivanovii]